MRLVYFSPVPWTSFDQRSHKFVEWFHTKFGKEVLWIDPYSTRLPELGDFWRIVGGNQEKKIVKEITPGWLRLLCPRSFPIEPLPIVNGVNRRLWSDVLLVIDTFIKEGKCQIAIGKPSELALQVLNRYPDVSSIYDAMDDFPAFYRGLSRRAMRQKEQKVASQVTKILVSSTALAARFSMHQVKLTVVLNACSISNPPSVFNSNINNLEPRIIVGYIGTVGRWFDWPLVCSLAKANPSICIRVIGPIYALCDEPIPSNIALWPACDHESAIARMQEFSVGLIPFKRTILTQSVDPIKYYEYRALGLPVLTTSFGEMTHRKDEAGIFFIDKHTDLTQIVRQAMSFEDKFDDIQKFRIKNSWEVRFNASNI